MNPLKHAWRSVTPEVSVVVPVRNESDNVLMLAGRIRLALSRRRVEVILVDDSDDLRTSHVAVAARALFKTRNFHVRFVHRGGSKRWGGLSGAVIDGIKRARAGQIIVMDGDLQHPPEVLPKLLEAAAGHDVVIASRYCDGGDAAGLDGGVRRMVSLGSTRLAKFFFPKRLARVSDPMTGFFLVRRSAIDLSLLRPKGFKILLEILARHKNLKVTEIPFEFAERQAGESKGDMRQGVHFFGQLFKIKNANALDNFCRLPRLVRFGGIGAGVFATGMLTLAGLVEILMVPLLLANGVQLALTFWLNYILNRNLTWRDRKISRQAASRFLISRLATTVFNFYLFAWLVTLQTTLTIAGQVYELSVNYLAANVISLAIIMSLNFLVSDRWAFAAKRTSSFRFPKYVPTVAAFALITALLSAVALQSVLLSVAVLFVLISLFMFVQASIEVWRTTYGYRNPEAVEALRFPAPLAVPRERFCLIVPARHEAEVLAGTLKQLTKQTHPNVDIVTVLCDDDEDTLAVAHAVAAWHDRVSVVEYPLQPGTKPSKPRQLNYVLEQIAGKDYTVIGIVDAEDTVHPQLMAHVDAAFADRKVQIVQGGVQLMDFDSSWYSLHNVLEYWRWFNSAMVFQADGKFMPLGGNTIFIRHKLLKRAGGWPLSLTEDCALGVTLSARYRAKTAVYYEPRLATQEETPESLTAFFRQRVRWNQGFFAEWRKGSWRRLPTMKQRLLAMYVLGSPVILAFGGVMAVAAVISAATLKAPVALTLLTYAPFIPLTLLLMLNAVLLYDFGKAYDQKVRIRHYAQLFATFGLYLVILNLAALWSMVRELRGNTTWHKTAHSGKHRSGVQTAMGGGLAVSKELR